MSGDRANAPTAPRLWCVSASDAPIIGVIARCSEHWTCFLRWKWSERTLEEGAWTNLWIAAHRCCLSPDGEFLLYFAKGSVASAFSGMTGGAYAISRLPWMSALTDTESFAGGFETIHALRQPEQDRLWSLFESWPKYVRDEDWPKHLGSAWTEAAFPFRALGTVAPRHSFFLCATACIPSTKLMLVAVIDAPYRLPRWSVWNRDVRFFVAEDEATSENPTELAGIVWATPGVNGHVLVATEDAKLRSLRYTHGSRHDETPVVESEHDLQGLTPNQGPSPAWAKAPLK